MRSQNCDFDLVLCVCVCVCVCVCWDICLDSTPKKPIPLDFLWILTLSFVLEIPSALSAVRPPLDRHIRPERGEHTYTKKKPASINRAATGKWVRHKKYIVVKREERQRERGGGRYLRFRIIDTSGNRSLFFISLFCWPGRAGLLADCCLFSFPLSQTTSHFFPPLPKIHVRVSLARHVAINVPSWAMCVDAESSQSRLRQ
jgi:hypothetical protein